jgi:flagellar biosynthetic protein FlhB
VNIFGWQRQWCGGMAESESGQERSEEATAKRQETAREEGQIARSRELNTMFILLAGSGGLMVYGPDLAVALRDLMRFNFSMPRAVAFDVQLVAAYFMHSVQAVGKALLPLLALLTAAAIAGPIALGGWLFSTKGLAPKGSRLNPLEGLKRMFSVTAVVELVKSLAKFIVMAGLAVILINSLKQRLLELGLQSPESAMADALHMTMWSVLGVSCGMILIALIDVPYQLFEHSRKLKMTKQEIKEEMKDSEGRPEVKGRIRQLQREMARRRMMEAVPKADVIITNPDHFSVALRYDSRRGAAPVVVAKGADQVALKIREIANAHKVTILAAPTLARAIYYTTEIEAEIPGPLYLAVAQVLAYVFQLKTYRAGQGRKPTLPERLPIPDDLTFDQRGRKVSGAATT